MDYVVVLLCRRLYFGCAMMVRIPLMWNAESGDLERGFRRSGTLVGAQRRLVSQ